MNWKTIAIVLIVALVVFAVLVGAYSFGLFPVEEEVVDDGTSTVTESFDFSGSIQSDFWDGFSSWLWTNLWWMCLCGVVVTLASLYVKSRN